MKETLIVVLMFAFVAGCSWTPERENTADPHSPFYVEPHFNHRPRIDSLRMITDCFERDQGDFCAFDVYCWVSDSDNNIVYDSILVRLDTIELGRMTFNPEINGFSVRKLQSETPADNLDSYVGDLIRVTVRDDSGAVAVDSVEFHDLNKIWPVKTHPIGDPVPDSIRTYHPRLGWSYWRTCDNDPHSFAVSVVEGHLNSVWDTSGLAATPATCLTDTFAIVSDSLHEGFPGPIVEYTWFITVVTRRGDRVTAKPGNFYIKIH